MRKQILLSFQKCCCSRQQPKLKRQNSIIAMLTVLTDENHKGNWLLSKTVSKATETVASTDKNVQC